MEQSAEKKAAEKKAKAKKSSKEILFMKIPGIYAWIAIGGLSSAVLIAFIALIVQA